MEFELPTEFDLIVIGTGVVESVVSAAASRVGKTVLHLDRNDYYGGQWASFNLQNLHNLSPKYSLNKVQSASDFIPIGNDIFTIDQFQCKWHVPDDENGELMTSEAPTESQEMSSEKSEKDEYENGGLDNSNEAETDPEKNSAGNSVKYSTSKSLLKESRKFNIDLAPKLHYARGAFVELLISSNIARYAEYRSVSRVLTWLNGKLEVVPCSRSDVFANNQVSVIEKRMLMKLLTSLDETNDSLKDDKITFLQFLKEKKLSQNLIHYVLYAMSRSTDETSLKDGIENTKRFLNSLGRFGKTPFLFCMYGSGETTQAFCRLSAVFGGIYALNQETLAGIKTEGQKIKVVLNGKQEIKAEHFVFGAENAPKEFVKFIDVKDYISRAIFVTDKSIMPSEQEHLTLLMYPPENGKNIVTVIEMSSLTGTCPKNLYLVHLTSKQLSNPRDDFKHILENLFITNTDITNSQELQTKPKILWSCFFSLPDTSNLNLKECSPENAFFCSGPDLELDYDSSIKQAKGIFEKIYPDLEFLPRAPDPEEIIIEGESNQESGETLTSNSNVNEENRIEE